MDELVPLVSTTFLESYQEDGISLNAAAFKELHGDLFFLHHGALAKLHGPPGPQRTLDAEGDDDPGKRSTMVDFVVFNLSAPCQQPADECLVWIGRSEENDLVIPDATVSGVHAFLRLEADGRLVMHDAGSRNGTLVEGKPVPSPGVGPPVALEPGALVVLGNVKLTFLRSAELRNLVVQLFGNQPRPPGKA